jgi:hypothetical protein
MQRDVARVQRAHRQHRVGVAQAGHEDDARSTRISGSTAAKSLRLLLSHQASIPSGAAWRTCS